MSWNISRLILFSCGQLNSLILWFSFILLNLRGVIYGLIEFPLHIIFKNNFSHWCPCSQSLVPRLYSRRIACFRNYWLSFLRRYCLLLFHNNKVWFSCSFILFRHLTVLFKSKNIILLFWFLWYVPSKNLRSDWRLLTRIYKLSWLILKSFLRWFLHDFNRLLLRHINLNRGFEFKLIYSLISIVFEQVLKLLRLPFYFQYLLVHFAIIFFNWNLVAKNLICIFKAT